MRSDDPLRALRDMRDHILHAQRFVAGMSFTQFQEDLRTVFAVIRCLEVISVASRRVPDSVKARHSELPWSDMAAAGNVYRHRYEDIRHAILWKTMTHSLPPLLTVIEQELARGTR